MGHISSDLYIHYIVLKRELQIIFLVKLTKINQYSIILLLSGNNLWQIR